MNKNLQILIALVALSVVAPADAASRYWLGGEDPVTLTDKHKTQPADFMDLFAHDSPWQRSSKGLSIFKISLQFASNSKDADLARLITDLQRRHIALAIEMGMLRNDRGCGKGEGYVPDALAELAMQRIHKFGGQLEYVAMDEVVFFGKERYWPINGLPACRDSIKELVNEVAQRAAFIHQYFPQAKIGATEPVTSDHDLDPNRLIQDYFEFADLYLAKTGSRLAFFHADIAWRSKNWRPGIALLKKGLTTRGIPFGIIIGGNPDYTDDVSWTRAGLIQLRRLATNSETSPEDIIIQSWQPLPTKYLPDSTPGTSTWMLLQAEIMVH